MPMGLNDLGASPGPNHGEMGRDHDLLDCEEV